jgi:hypothetical protein
MAAATLAAPAVAQGYVLRTTADGIPLRWPVAPITVDVDSSVTQLDPAALSAVERAFSHWQSVSETSVPPVSVAVGAAGAIGYQVGAQNRCSVRYEASGYAPAGDALAVTVVSFEDDGTIVDADVVINGRPNRYFQVLSDADADGGGNGDSVFGNVFDIEEVVTHEAGHFFGLAHNDAAPSAVMYYETDPETIGKRELTEDDKAGIRALYTEGGPPGVACNVAARTRGNHGLWWMVGIGAFFALAHRRHLSSPALLRV